MSIYFFPIDDCQSNKVISLTGVLIPVSIYNSVRESIYNFILNIHPEVKKMAQPLELHGCELLKDLDWATNEIKFSCFKEIVKIINENDLRIYRVGYLKETVKNTLKTDPKLASLTYMAMNTWVQPELEHGILIPIMDGLDEAGGKPANLFGQSVSKILSMGLGDSCIVGNAHNLCEPLFASSKYSAVMQIADMTSYLLHALDYENEPVGEFKKELQKIALTIKSDLLKNIVIPFQEH